MRTVNGDAHHIEGIRPVKYWSPAIEREMRYASLCEATPDAASKTVPAM
jgi:hypothetical protein